MHRERSTIDASRRIWRSTKSGPITVTTGGRLQLHSDASTTTVRRMPAVVVMTDTLPPGVVVSGALRRRLRRSATTGVVVTCTVCQPCAAGASATMQVDCGPADPAVCFEGKVNNYVTVSPDRYVSSTGSPPFLPEPDPTNNQADWGTIIFSQADLSITKTASSPVIAGETATFTLTVNNAGLRLRHRCARDRGTQQQREPERSWSRLSTSPSRAPRATVPDRFFARLVLRLHHGVCERGTPMPNRAPRHHT